REQAELYVLGALAPVDRNSFEAHIASCAECATHVKSLSSVTQALAYVAPQHDPPDSLRARVVSSVTGSPVKVAPIRQPVTVSSGTTLPWLAAAASLVLAAALGIYAANLRSRVGTLE